jgi:hypothetical protein
MIEPLRVSIEIDSPDQTSSEYRTLTVRTTNG